MIRFLAFPHIALLVALSACGVLPGPGAVPDAEVLSALESAMLEAHNAARASATPAPAPALPDLTWSTELAGTATAWAARCVFEHSTGNLGENLAVFSPRELDADLARGVVELWDGERVDYTYDTNSCRAGAQCGHYTQIVWRDTTAIGCGVAECDDVTGFGAGSLWVCNYAPAGNFVGQRPY